MWGDHVYRWVTASKRRVCVVVQFDQPLTVRQLCRRTALTLRACSDVLSQLVRRRLARCLNPRSRRCRVYGLTRTGVWCQGRMRRVLWLGPLLPTRARIDWSVYGAVCHNHRSAVVLALAEPLRPPMVKRRAQMRDPKLRISANNVREVLSSLQRLRVTRRRWIEEYGYPHHELTRLGREARRLLIGAEMPRPECAKFRCGEETPRLVLP